MVVRQRHGSPREQWTRRRQAERLARNNSGRPANQRTERLSWPTLWRCGILVASVFFAYWNSLNGPFIGDDLRPIVEDTGIREWWHPWAMLFPRLHSPITGRPLVALSLAANYAIGGLHPTGYHVVNIAFHALCACLLFTVVRHTLELPRVVHRLPGCPINVAFAVALVWAIHPLNSEVVDYIIQRSESMMAVFLLLTLYACIRGLQDDRNRMWPAIATASCVLGVGCKESMATAPLLVMLYDRSFGFDSAREAFRARRKLYGGLAASWLILAALVVWGRGATSDIYHAGISPWVYLLNETIVIPHYLRLAVWPRDLVAVYGWAAPLGVAQVVPYGVFILVLVILACVAWIRRPQTAFPALWFFITLAPTSSVVPLETEVAAERRLYVPLMAIVVMMVIAVVIFWNWVAKEWLGVVVERRISRSVGLVALISVTVALATATVSRNRDYRSAISLLRTAVERRPTSLAHHLLGMELEAAGAHDEAVAELRKALPADSRAHYNLGVALFEHGQPDEAIGHLQAFIDTSDPSYDLVPRWLEPTAAEVLRSRLLIAQALLAKHFWPQALEQSRLILATSPSTVEAHGYSGESLLGLGRFAEAVPEYRQFLEAHPENAIAWSHLGVAFSGLGQEGAALEMFRKAIALEPHNEEAERNMAVTFFNQEEFADAETHARQAIRLDARDPLAHDLLGRVLVVQGHLTDGAREFERALELNPAYKQAQVDLQEVDRRRRQ